MFSIILLILFIPVCLLLILIVLLQAGKGGGLAGAFGGVGDQAFLGARGTADFLGKVTIYLAIGFMSLALLLSFTYGRQNVVRMEEPKAAETETQSPGAETQTEVNQGTTDQPQTPVTEEESQPPPSDGNN
jgi:preprotein translocase subunit SecG